ncbi:MAG TPA: hypothetical protein VE981_06485 [Planctomycetota bacterium]|nr:hypothetical protein [Planctomycetota bacterium]
MSNPRPGRRLAVALRVSPPRWLEFVRSSVVIAACLVPLGYFVVALCNNAVGKNSGLLESIAGLLGLFLLVRRVRITALWILAGRTVVEVSREPAAAGQPLDYVIEQRRTVDAALVCSQDQGRHSTQVTLVSVPLEAGGLRSVTLPDLIPAGGLGNSKRLEWHIDVRVRFGRGLVLEEEYPLRVDSTAKAAPSTDLLLE